MTWRRLARGGLPWETFRSRSRILEQTRAFFRARGFLEVDPPIATAYPNIDPNVFPVCVSDASGKKSRLFLHTSPELSMKKLLAAGSGNIFFLGKVFRDREGSPLHHSEFTMLEWYRVGEPAEAVMTDVEDLVGELALAVSGNGEIRRGGMIIPLSRPWPRWEVRDAFRSLLGTPSGDEAGLRAALVDRGLAPGDGERWDDLFFRALIDVIEPALGKTGACFLTGFPAALAAMAKGRTDDAAVSERFEGYLGGVELVNGYEELTDPREQEERLRGLAARLGEETGREIPVDPGFLAALQMGLPPCSGAALGMDRLVMLLLGKDSIDDVTLR